MKIQATKILHSRNELGKEIMTVKVTFPRFILAELNTHRMLSKNSASSRAIPFEKMVESVRNNPCVPIAWQKHHKGMQGNEYIQPPFTEDTTLIWHEAKDAIIKKAQELYDYGVTKQLANRLLEPFMWHTVLITATEWENFFALRCPQYQFGESPVFRSKQDALEYFSDDPSYHSMIENYSKEEWLQFNKGQAEIHMMALAEAIWDVYNNKSDVKDLRTEEWHIPFSEDFDMGHFASLDGIDTERLVKVSTARCARVSYTVVGDEKENHEYSKDEGLHDRLAESGHWSPFEHCAQALANNSFVGNFSGFLQYRKLFDNENITV